jgi:hypothetical protein
MNDPASEFERLLQLRDLAAYRAVSVIQMVLDFFEAQDYESAVNMLDKARAEFDQADLRVVQFRKTLESATKQPTQGEKARHGNRTDNSAA